MSSISDGSFLDRDAVKRASQVQKRREGLARRCKNGDLHLAMKIHLQETGVLKLSRRKRKENTDKNKDSKKNDEDIRVDQKKANEEVNSQAELLWNSKSYVSSNLEVDESLIDDVRQLMSEEEAEVHENSVLINAVRKWNLNAKLANEQWSSCMDDMRTTLQVWFLCFVYESFIVVHSWSRMITGWFSLDRGCFIVDTGPTSYGEAFSYFVSHRLGYI